MRLGVWYCGNIVVATFLCLNISLLSAAGAPINIAGLDIDKERQRAFRAFADQTFGEKLVVNNRTVRCNGKSHGSTYPAPMYTCDEISVDGEKLYHGMAVESSSSKRSRSSSTKEQCSDGCPCGRDEGQANDINALCSAMLREHGVAESLTAAYVVKPHCKSSDNSETRVKYYIDDAGVEVWESVKVTNGYINTLQCLTTLPDQIS